MWPEKRPRAWGRFLLAPSLHGFVPMKAPESAQAILENLTTAVVTLDRELRLTGINPAGEMMFEASTERIAYYRPSHYRARRKRRAARPSPVDTRLRDNAAGGNLKRRRPRRRG